MLWKDNVIKKRELMFSDQTIKIFNIGTRILNSELEKLI